MNLTASYAASSPLLCIVFCNYMGLRMINAETGMNYGRYGKIIAETGPIIGISGMIVKVSGMIVLNFDVISLNVGRSSF